jgi:hypothetical protein
MFAADPDEVKLPDDETPEDETVGCFAPYAVTVQFTVPIGSFFLCHDNNEVVVCINRAHAEKAHSLIPTREAIGVFCGSQHIVKVKAGCGGIGENANHEVERGGFLVIVFHLASNEVERDTQSRPGARRVD